MLNKDTDREHLAVETNAAGVETFALPDPEAIEESSIDALPHSQPKISPAYDASTMVRVGESGNIQNAAQEAGFTIGDTPDGLTEAEREEKKKQDEEFHEALSGALEEQKERQERERQEAHAKEWDEKIHNVGKYKFTGAQLHASWEYLQNADNADAYEQELMSKLGISREEAKKRRLNLQEYLNLQEKERRGEELTPEEREQLNNPSHEVAEDANITVSLAEKGRLAEMKGGAIGRSAANHQDSVTSRTHDFVTDQPLPAESVTLFASSSPSGIKADIHLTETYNSHSSPNVIDFDKQQPAPKPNTIATIEPAGSMGLG